MTIRYEIGFFRNGAALPLEDNPVRIAFTRVLDGISGATLNFNAPSNVCCEQLGELEPLADTLVVKRNGTPMWFGWIQSIAYDRDNVLIDAQDALGWLQRRVVHADQTYPAGTDLSTIFTGLWNDALIYGDLNIILNAQPSGATGSREYLAAEYRNVFDLVRELFNTGLDATVLGQALYIGGLDFGTLQFGIDDFEGNVKVTKQGGSYVNRSIVKGESGVVGISPVGPATGVPPWPVVERVNEDSNITDVVSAQSAADSRIAFSPVVPRILETPQGARLKRCDDDLLARLNPGARVLVDTRGLCYESVEEFRLSGVSVEVTGGQESVGVTLQPVGSDSLTA